MESLETMFSQLKALLQKYANEFEERDEYIGSVAKTKKPAYHLYGKKVLSIIAGRKPQQTYFAGIVLQKNFVGLYFMPIYSHPNSFSVSPGLRKFIKGKSCLNISHLDKALFEEIDLLLAKGLRIYKKEGWV